MKYVQHEHARHDPQVTARRDRATLLHRRVQILGLLAIPCLLIIVGVGLGPFPLPWIAFLAVFVMLLSLYLFNACLLRENPRLRKASRWRGFRSTYQESVMGLDEREKLVIDQAFRTSYRILAMACYLVAFCLFIINIAPAPLHLVYHLGVYGGACIFGGVLCLLQYLPTTVVAWHESVWVQEEEARVR